MTIEEYNPQDVEDMKYGRSQNFKVSDAMRRINGRRFLNDISEETGDLTRRACNAYNTIPKKTIEELRGAKD